MLKKITAFCFSFLLAFFLVIPFFSVNAQNLNNAFKVSDGSYNDTLDTLAGRAGYDTAHPDVYKNVSNVINFALSFLGIIFILLMIYGGWLWMTDQGSEEQVEKAKKIITAAIIGVIIIVSSYAISWFIINALSERTLKAS